MSEILFRGKQISDGGWVYGYPYSDGKKSYIAYEGKKDCIIHEVVPETLKPYTGLLDKNSKKIFEGDILKRIVAKQEIIYTVDWCDNCALFVLPCITREELETDFTIFNGYDFEIIGNIHDTPELMGGNQT